MSAPQEASLLKSLDPLRAKKTFIRKKVGHTAVSAIKPITQKENKMFLLSLLFEPRPEKHGFFAYAKTKTEWHHLDSSKARSDIRDSAKALIPGPVRYQHFFLPD